MNVASVQKHFRDLAGLLADVSGAKNVVAELSAFAAALEPCRSMSVAKFGEFLRLAEEHQRTGKLDPSVPSRSKSVASKTEPAEAIRRVTILYQTILQPNITSVHIESELALLDGLKKADLLQVANVVGTHDAMKSRKVDDVRTALKKAIRDRRGMFERPDY